MRNRGQLALGIILILLGVLFFAQRQYPVVAQWMNFYMQWPLNIVAAGALILVIGLLLGVPSMAIPAAIVAGIGGILYFQVKAEDMQSWEYMWTLIPGFIGIGMILAGLLARNLHQARSGVNLMVISAVLFIIFAAFFGRLNLLGAYGPAILLVVLGLWVLIRGFLRGGNRRDTGSSGN
jgi:peptidoglycan/LPS O-acetylase OafA/YrhL